MTPERLREIAEAATWDRDRVGYKEASAEWQIMAVAQDQLADLAPDLARVAAGLAEAARAYQALFKAWEGRDNLTLNDEALRQWKSIADVALAAFAELGEQTDTQAATEVRVSGEESKATTGTVT